MTTPDKLAALRAAMRAQSIDACLVLASDPHLSEYLPPRWQGREWLSGFTGSVGTLIVCAEHAGLWTDGRYWTQAETELAGSGIELMKLSSGASLQYIDWLAAHLQPGQVAAVDANVLGLAVARQLRQTLAARGISLRTDLDLLDAIWPARPGLPAAPVFEHAAPYATLTRAAKLAQVRAAMAAAGATRHLVSTLDDIAWLLNLRGSDIAYNPVFCAHLLLGADSATLFVEAAKLAPELQARLAADGVRLAPYGAAAAAVGALDPDETLLIDPRRITAGLRDCVPAAMRVIEALNPSTLAKSRKSAADIANVRATMEQDGAALCAFFAWLEPQLARPAACTLRETDIADQLLALRVARPGFISPSFSTIAGFNSNGAVIHYRAHPATAATINADGLLLIDSGGQYLGGTTDITRVVAVGQASAAQRRDFTLVLKGMIALSVARFPRATRSPMLDAIARAPLWAAGADYGHGTGHGVGYFLNVHEGPQSISPAALATPETALEEGMITSNEPGLYRPGRWGIRIENLVLTVAAGQTEFGDFLAFETLTLCPIDTRLIERSLLRQDEIDWLNAYHASVRARLLPHVDGAARAWLEQRTEAL
ncbi:aminopeptidase P family protein [Massilia sp. TS11]|uniref:aminopeptidase P family protein n=1 Tax=Massilia sp. TS11 TaxID=2908003 RepID=UPI001EDA6F65|nr:aminopeptidase P family protein [Massilia sp. TS11]MCG2585282.1 aminopeptidase P family protein [Massilia sp. TS11]